MGRRLARAGASGWRGPSAFPSAATTGPAPGTVFQTIPGQVTSGTGWAWQPIDEYVIISGNNTVFDSYICPWNIAVNSTTGVRISNCVIEIPTAPSPDVNGITLNSTANTWVTNCTIAGTDSAANRINDCVSGVTGTCTGTVVTGCNMFNCRNGVEVPTSALVRDNYIHDFGYQDDTFPGHSPGDDDHTNGVISSGNTSTAWGYVLHNTILLQLGQTGAVDIFEDTAVNQNWLVEGNLVAGGAYTIYGGAENEGTYGVPSNIVIRNNWYSTVFASTGGVFGPYAYLDLAGTGNVWANNRWIDGSSAGQLIP